MDYIYNHEVDLTESRRMVKTFRWDLGLSVVEVETSSLWGDL